MQKPEKPKDEVLRLSTLLSLNLLDTNPKDERFDRLTRMACRVFNVPIAVISLVDGERQWFKSCIGHDMRETSRDISFCGHAILDEDIFIVPDALADERFADNPQVINDPFVRFYAGCQIRALNGSKVGMLCLIDHEKRGFSDEDKDTLKDLTSMIEHEIAAMQLATMDELTNISNRRGFMMLTKQALSLCVRQSMPASLVFFDLNGFKVINDIYGHQEGDRALVDFVNIVKECLRVSDIFARIGGDEFVAVLVNTPLEFANVVIDRAQQALNEYNCAIENSFNISFSFGVVAYDVEKYKEIEDLLVEGGELMDNQKREREAAQQYDTDSNGDIVISLG